MSGSLFDQCGARKYLVLKERQAFVATARRECASVRAFCMTLAFSGARLSEVLCLTGQRIDYANGAIVVQTLKQRGKVIYRAIPVPPKLLALLEHLRPIADERLWKWGRTNAWKVVKRVMRKAGIAEDLCKPKALRHAFAVEAGQKGVPLNIVQRWLGHARIETTAIYLTALGDEERQMARNAWKALARSL